MWTGIYVGCVQSTTRLVTPWLWCSGGTFVLIAAAGRSRGSLVLLLFAGSLSKDRCLTELRALGSLSGGRQRTDGGPGLGRSQPTRLIKYCIAERAVRVRRCGHFKMTALLIL